MSAREAESNNTALPRLVSRAVNVGKWGKDQQHVVSSDISPSDFSKVYLSPSLEESLSPWTLEDDMTS